VTLKGGREGQTFQADLLNYHHTVRPRTTKFDKTTHVEEKVYLLWGQPRPHLKSGAPALPKFWASLQLYLCLQPLPLNDQIGVVKHMGRLGNRKSRSCPVYILALCKYVLLADITSLRGKLPLRRFSVSDCLFSFVFVQI